MKNSLFSRSRVNLKLRRKIVSALTHLKSFEKSGPDEVKGSYASGHRDGRRFNTTRPQSKYYINADFVSFLVLTLQPFDIPKIYWQTRYVVGGRVSILAAVC